MGCVRFGAHVARQEVVLSLPVRVSPRFPSRRDADEGSWQKLVIRHLDIPEWAGLVFRDELDNVGPYARTVLEGTTCSGNVHADLLIAEQAPGATLLTGPAVTSCSCQT